jgi:hypothetical protein
MLSESQKYLSFFLSLGTEKEVRRQWVFVREDVGVRKVDYFPL